MISENEMEFVLLDEQFNKHEYLCELAESGISPGNYVYRLSIQKLRSLPSRSKKVGHGLILIVILTPQECWM
jgi:hypothetical protein